MDILTPADVSQENLPGWGIFKDDVIALRSRADTGTFSRGLGFVNRIGELAEEAGHHPDLTLTYPNVDITLTTHDAGGLTRADVELAKQIALIAGMLDIVLAPPER